MINWRAYSGVRFVRWLPAVVLAVSIGIVGSSVAAPAPFVALSYEVDPTVADCPSQDEFRSAVSMRVGYEPFRSDSTLVVHARVWKGAGGYEGALDWGRLADARLGERRFTSQHASCNALISAMVFALSVQVQMMAVEEKATPSPEAAPDAGSAGPSVAVATTPATPATGGSTDSPEPVTAGDKLPPRSWKGHAGVGGAIAFGVAPTWTALGRGFVAVHNERWLFEMGAEASLPVTGRLDTGARFSQRLLLGTGAVCTGRGALSACVVAKLGGMKVRGQNVDKPGSPTGFVAQVGPRLGWSYFVGDHVGLRARIDGLYLLTPWTVELNQVTVWTMPRLGVGVGIDLFVHGE